MKMKHKALMVLTIGMISYQLVQTAMKQPITPKTVETNAQSLADILEKNLLNKLRAWQSMTKEELARKGKQFQTIRQNFENLGLEWNDPTAQKIGDYLIKAEKLLATLENLAQARHAANKRTLENYGNELKEASAIMLESDETIEELKLPRYVATNAAHTLLDAIKTEAKKQFNQLSKDFGNLTKKMELIDPTIRKTTTSILGYLEKQKQTSKLKIETIKKEVKEKLDALPEELKKFEKENKNKKKKRSLMS